MLVFVNFFLKSSNSMSLNDYYSECKRFRSSSECMKDIIKHSFDKTIIKHVNKDHPRIFKHVEIPSIIIEHADENINEVIDTVDVKV